MGQAPTGHTSLSGQTGQGATPNPKKPIIRVFGERHTGTRAMTQMINGTRHLRAGYFPKARPEAQRVISILETAVRMELELTGKSAAQEILRDVDYDARPRAAGWKHMAMQWDVSFNALSGVILSRRNPYSWAIAMFARPYHVVGQRKKDLTAFLTMPWLTIPREHMDAAIATPIALWTAKQVASAQFAQASQIPVTKLALEAFVADPVASLGSALAALGHHTDKLQARARSTKNREPIEVLQRRHVEQSWRDWLTASQVAAINDQLDPAVMAESGYDIENPEHFPEVLSPEATDAFHAHLATKRKNM